MFNNIHCRRFICAELWTYSPAKGGPGQWRSVDPKTDEASKKKVMTVTHHAHAYHLSLSLSARLGFLAFPLPFPSLRFLPHHFFRPKQEKTKNNPTHQSRGPTHRLTTSVQGGGKGRRNRGTRRTAGTGRQGSRSRVPTSDASPTRPPPFLCLHTAGSLRRSPLLPWSTVHPSKSSS